MLRRVTPRDPFKVRQHHASANKGGDVFELVAEKLHVGSLVSQTGMQSELCVASPRVKVCMAWVLAALGLLRM